MIQWWSAIRCPYLAIIWYDTTWPNMTKWSLCVHNIIGYNTTHNIIYDEMQCDLAKSNRRCAYLKTFWPLVKMTFWPAVKPQVRLPGDVATVERRGPDGGGGRLPRAQAAAAQVRPDRLWPLVKRHWSKGFDQRSKSV